MSNDEKPKRDSKLIIPYPREAETGSVKYEYPGKDELMKLMPPAKEPDPEKRKDYGAYITLEEDNEGKLKVVGGKNPEQIFEEIADSKPEEWQDPRGPSSLRDAWIPWKMKIEAQSRLAQFYHQYYGEFEATVPSLADDVWVLYEYNANRFATGIDPARVFVELCHISYPLALNDGFHGSEPEWADVVYDAGRTHRHRKRHQKPQNTEEKEGVDRP
jgi:hypothetical protein